MRALLIAAAAATLVGLAGCGQGTGDTGDDVSVGTDSSSAVVEPTPPEVTRTPPDTKPQDPPGESEPATSPSAPVTLSEYEPVVPPGVRQVPAEQVDASAVPEYNEYRGLVWVYDDGYSLQAFAMATSGCDGLEGEVAAETASEVVIAVRPLPQPQGGPADGRMCTTVMTPRPVTVTLDAPLGDRTVRLDGGR